MKVFLSWSGDKSHTVALAFRDWLPSVIQSLEPYVSSEDLDKGTRWSTDIAKELADSSFGILCVTKDNQFEPWLNFEAGALSKTIDETFVSPFLFDISRTEVTGPILQFQSTIFARDDVAKLLGAMNRACGDSKLTNERLERAFDVWWPRLESTLNKIKGTSEATDGETEEKHSSSLDETLGEILYLSQQNQMLLRKSTAEDVPKSVADLRVHVEKSIAVIREEVQRWATERRNAGRRSLVETFEMARSLERREIPAPIAFPTLVGVFRDKAPLFYELGMGVFRTVQSSRSDAVRRKAVREFERTIDSVLKDPMMPRVLFGEREEMFLYIELAAQLKRQAVALIDEGT